MNNFISSSFCCSHMLHKKILKQDNEESAEFISKLYKLSRKTFFSKKCLLYAISVY